MKKTLTAALLCASSGFLFSTRPIFANELIEANKVLTYKNEQSLVDILNKEFDQDLKDLDFVETKGDVYYFESEDYEVVVEGLDLESEGQQSVAASLYSKEVNEILDDMGFPVSSIQSIQIEVEVQDLTSPEIEADDVYKTSLNTSLNLKDLVKVSDDKDENVELSVDGDIDYSKEGKYTVRLQATDNSGNTTTKDVTVEVTDELFYQRIADAALAQIGVNQDCTMLVTNSLAAVGINFHGAPEQYLSLGTLTDNPVPGDICVYNGHVAIYVGDGKAVHGGWNGGTTVLTTVSCSQAFIGYVHVAH